MRTMLAILLIVVAGTAAAGSQVRDPRPPAPRPTAGTAQVAGLVQDAAGRPVPNATVVLASTELNVSAQTIADPSGRFQFANVPQGVFTLIASHPLFLPGEYGQSYIGERGRSLRIAAGDSVRAQLRLMRGGAVNGRILDPFGLPAIDIPVQAFRIEHDGDRRRFVAVSARTYRSNDIGQYRLSKLPPGDYYLAAQPPQIAVATGTTGAPAGLAMTWYPGTASPQLATPVRIQPEAENEGIDFQLVAAPLVWVTGSITGAPAARRPGELSVQLVARDGAIELPQRFRGGVQADGQFLIERVPPGRYHLIAEMSWLPQYGPSAKQPEPLIGWQPVDVIDRPLENVALAMKPPGRIRGRVDADAPLPAGTRITIATNQVQGWAPNAQTASVTPEQLTFSVPAAPGLVRIQVSGLPPGWVVRSVTAAARDAFVDGVPMNFTDLDGAVVSLSAQGARLTGSLKPSGTQPRDFTVVLLAKDSRERRTNIGGLRIIRPDSRGEFAIDAIRPGAYIVAAVEAISPAQHRDQETWKRIETLGQTVTFAQGELKTLQLSLVSLY